MRTPSEYIAAAVRRVQSSYMPDCKATMTHGAYSGDVTRVSTSHKGEESVTTDGATEAVRVLALHTDFPEVENGSFVWIGDCPHIVTSLRTDPTKVSLTIGLSQELHKYAAKYEGTRRDHRISETVQLLAENNGLTTVYTEGFAPSNVYGWTVVIPHDAWVEVAPPQIGDDIYLDDERIRVSHVESNDAAYIIMARGR